MFGPARWCTGSTGTGRGSRARSEPQATLVWERRDNFQWRQQAECASVNVPACRDDAIIGLLDAHSPAPLTLSKQATQLRVRQLKNCQLENPLALSIPEVEVDTLQASRVRE